MYNQKFCEILFQEAQLYLQSYFINLINLGPAKLSKFVHQEPMDDLKNFRIGLGKKS